MPTQFLSEVTAVELIYIPSKKFWLRQYEREYDKNIAEQMESISDKDPTQFWEQIKKLGPQRNKQIRMQVYDDHGAVKCHRDEVLNTGKWLQKPVQYTWGCNFRIWWGILCLGKTAKTMSWKSARF